MSTSTGRSFIFWVRSVLESEKRVPDWLIEILNRRCPGFVENERELTPKAAKGRPLPLRLEDWIDDHVFGFAKQEGWFNTVSVLRNSRSALPESRSLLVAVRQEREEKNEATPLPYLRGMEADGRAVRSNRTSCPWTAQTHGLRPMA